MEILWQLRYLGCIKFDKGPMEKDRVEMLSVAKGKVQ